MSAPLLPEVLLRRDATQAEFQLAADGVLRTVWEGRFGTMLIEVEGDRVRVNGELVEPADAPAARPRGG